MPSEEMVIFVAMVTAVESFELAGVGKLVAAIAVHIVGIQTVGIEHVVGSKPA